MMKKTVGHMLLLLIMCCLSSVSSLYGDEVDLTKPLRIDLLLPKKTRMYSLGIEPAIPNHFVALSSQGELDACQFYWGPKEVLEGYFKNTDSLSQPILAINITEHIAQRKFGVLDEAYLRNEFDQLTKSGQMHDTTLDFGCWGNYPYCIISSTIQNHNINMAYVGLNHESGSILLFHLLIPKNAGPEMKKDALKLWHNFFQNTKELPEPLLYKALGQEMHTGYTLVTIVDRTVKVMAEKRKSDDRIRFSFIPQNSRVEFKFESSDICHKGIQWRLGDPMLKIAGSYIVDSGWIQLSMVTSIFIQEVDEFTPVNILYKDVFIKDL